MGAAYDVARMLGCVCRESAPFLRTVEDDLAGAWLGCSRGDWLAFALVRLGLPLERVLAVALEPAAEVPWIAQKLRVEVETARGVPGEWTEATLALNVYRLFGRYADVPMDCLAEAARDAFSLDEVLAALAARLEEAAP